jgi:hypothetical protein
LLSAQGIFGWVIFDMNLGICLLFVQVIVSGDDEIDDVVGRFLAWCCSWNFVLLNFSHI